MATAQELYGALQRADAAGDVEAAKAIAQMLSNMPPEEIQGLDQVQAVQEQNTTSEEPDFMARVAQTLKARGKQYKDIVAARDAGQQTDLESALQIIGKPIAGTFNDAIGGGIELVSQGLSAITPDAIKDPLANFFQSTTEAGTEAAVPALQKLMQYYEGFAQESPRAARNLESIGNIGMVAPIAKPLATGAQAAAKGVATGAKAAGRAAVSPIIPTVSPDIAPLAARAADFGIPLRLDQIAPSRARNTIQKVSQEIPFSGANAFEETQRAAFNKALAKTIGQDSDKLDPTTIQRFLKDSGGKFDSVLKGRTIPVDDIFSTQLTKIAEDASLTATDDAAKAVYKNIGKLRDDLLKGTVSGERLAAQRSELLKRQASAQGPIKDSIGDIIDAIDDLAERNLPEEAIQTLAQARREYRNFKTIEPLLEKATDGSINPTQLLNRVASSKYIKASRNEVGQDDLIDLARIGKEFLPAKGGSDTVQKAALAGGLSGVTGFSALANPIATGATLAGNRALQSLYNTSQPAVRAAIAKGLRKAKKE